ncbi:MAG: sulfatase-like hydrolase/transferase [Gemmatimonadetes bacterium]|nr:sulfatase-like hydrolase/transferase [Gemmatimonadota bacterium]
MGRGGRVRQCARRSDSHIDSIAAQGARLDNFNVEFSCTVSRAAMMTGRYAVRTGATQGTGFTLWGDDDRRSALPLGYATALYGKWHLGGPTGSTIGPPSIRDSTNGTASPTPATRRNGCRRRSSRPTRLILPSSGSSRPVRRRGA